MLTASAAPGSVFAGWSAPCASAPECRFVIESDVALTATFELGRYELELDVEGEGAGRILIEPGGIACPVPSTCMQELTGGTSITLTPEPEGRSTFRRWTRGPWVRREEIMHSASMLRPRPASSISVRSAVTTASRTD